MCMYFIHIVQRRENIGDHVYFIYIVQWKNVHVTHVLYFMQSIIQKRRKHDAGDPSTVCNFYKTTFFRFLN